ncbi:MAG: SAM-dependent methyltransferase [Deltaproteobacteria bacterium]
MKRYLALVLLTACSTPAKPAPEASASDALDAAVAAEGRPADDRARDGDRKPAEIMRYFGVAPGATVVDLMGGRGYYTELLSRAVGADGKVFAQNNRFILEKFAEADLAERVARLEPKNIVRHDRELDDLAFPAGEVDVAVMILFYHDAFWMEVDRAKTNAQIFAALKPGGIYGIIDHHAEAGSKDRDVKTLHRVDAAVVRAEIEAAGFELVGESELLRHPDDDRTKNVFDPSIRGKTDRFVFKFRKPE